MKKPIILPLLMLIMVSGCGNKACDNPQRSRNNDEIQLGIILNQDLEYCQEVQNISQKKCGANLYLQRKMLLANVANNYWKRNNNVSDSCLPIIEVLFMREQGDYDIYCINQIPPCFMSLETHTEIDVCGEYIVAYRIKDDPDIPESEIVQAGIMTDCGMVHINELSYFVAFKKNTLDHYVIANVVSEWEGLHILDSITNSWSS